MPVRASTPHRHRKIRAKGQIVKGSLMDNNGVHLLQMVYKIGNTTLDVRCKEAIMCVNIWQSSCCGVCVCGVSI